MHPTLRRVALIGSPNAGKTTLYNWMTGSHSKTINYPGATVDYSIGHSLDVYGETVEVIDTPGTYSLFPKTPEEVVTENILFVEDHHHRPELLIVVVDCTQFNRQMALVKQLQESGWPVIVALTMVDVIQKRGTSIDFAELSNYLNAPIVGVDGRLGGGVKELLDVTREALSNLKVCNIQTIEKWTQEQFDQTLVEIRSLRKRVFIKGDLSENIELTNKLDSFFLHPILGLALFALIMFTLFSSIFWAATPFMDFIDNGFSILAEKVLAVAPESLITDFLANGIIAGFGAFIIFIPQIFILFLGLNFLEDTGYLARAAALIDKPLSLLGLNGRSFVPLLSGHACAVPAMMAARTIPNKRERWLTLFILPLMTCSARIPVYALLLAFLFTSPIQAGIWLTVIYVASFVLGGVTSVIANKLLPKSPKSSSFFILELPHYRRPKLFTVFKLTYEKTKAFTFRAGPIIFVLSIVIWALTTFPNYQEKDDALRIQHSYAAKMGQVLEPVMEPMGLDWKAGVGIISSIAAREVFVSTMALIYNVADDDEDSMQKSLLSAMRNSTRPNGTPVFTTGSVAGLIVFYMIALQCIATLGVAKKEAGSWAFAASQLIIFNLAAYLLAIVTFQILS